MSEKIRFGFRKLFLCMAAYAAMFAWNRHLGWLGFFLALITGTTLSMVIYLARRRDVGSIAFVALGTVFGALLTAGQGSIVGALLFGMAASAINLVFREKPKANRDDSAQPVDSFEMSELD